MDPRYPNKRHRYEKQYSGEAVADNRTAKRMQRKNTQQQGFTLIELLMGMAILAILAAVALPSYNNYVTRSEIRAAQSDLIALSANFETRYQRTMAYTVVTATDDLTSVFDGWYPSSDDFNYTAVSSAVGYTITATGTGGNVNNCRVILNQANSRTILDCGANSGAWL